MEIAIVADTAILEFEDAMQNFKRFGLARMPKIGMKRQALVRILREVVNPMLRAEDFPEVDYDNESKLRSFCREYVVGTVNYTREFLREERFTRAGWVNKLYRKVENQVLYPHLQQRHT